MQDIPEDIVSKAAEGDLASFEALYRSTCGFVYNVAYRVLNNRQEAEEVTQEVFVNIHRNLKEFRFQSSVKTWIYRIAVNSALNRAKKLGRERDKRDEYKEDAVVAPDGAGGIPGNAIDKELVSGLLQSLNPDQRSCIVLRNIEGLSYQEIADTLQISINTVRTRLKRGRERLLEMGKELVAHEL